MKNKIIFIVLASIILLSITLGLVYYSNNTNTQQENLHYTDILILKNKYPHSTDSFTQGLFFYNNEMYESSRTVCKICII